MTIIELKKELKSDIKEVKNLIGNSTSCRIHDNTIKSFESNISKLSDKINKIIITNKNDDKNISISIATMNQQILELIQTKNNLNKYIWKFIFVIFIILFKEVIFAYLKTGTLGI